MQPSHARMLDAKELYYDFLKIKIPGVVQAPWTGSGVFE